ncbi:MAG: PAC2 family protein [Planctomycetales bacterium]|nr:PAC2 family protein [Planctomycetales bacterium]
MPEEMKLNKPWLIAVWPGMGHVAISAGYYLMAKLGMHLHTEFAATELFDVDHVEVKEGLIRPSQLPRSRIFVWQDGGHQHDIVLFLGEAQPPAGKYPFCRRLIRYALELGVERVFTFAAMATQMHPEHDSRVFGAATDPESLAELQELDLEILQDGHIGGLNGVLLGVAAEMGLRGACLLGEMPHLFSQLPFPKASLAVLKVFTMIGNIELDTAELAKEARAMDERLGELLAKIEHAIQRQAEPEEEAGVELGDEEGLSESNRQRIEKLFGQSREDRSKSYELKQLLDQLGVFAEYEDRFLDLFRKPESES